jgi:hypothetical protein
VVTNLGTEGAIRRLDELLGQAMQAIPDCRGRGSVEEFLRIAAERLCPPTVRRGEGTENTECAENTESTK